jgi:hypothetical protein
MVTEETLMAKRSKKEQLVPTTVLLTEELRRWHKGQAILDGVSFSEIVRRALETYRLRGRKALAEDPLIQEIGRVYGRSYTRPRTR